MEVQMSTQSVSHSQARVKQMTQDEYNRIRRIVFARVPRHWCDPEDALQYGLLVACQSYHAENSAALSTYVFKCAFYYAWKQFNRREGRYSIPFAALQKPDLDFDDFIDNLATANDDHSHLEPLDPKFVERIRERLQNKSDWYIKRGRFSKSPTRSDCAIRILELLAHNVKQDAGIGVDEYVNRPTHPRDRRVGFSNERAAQRQNLMQHFGLRYQEFDATMLGLRQETDRVIREHGIY
jgi:hypothetical protein